jgi:hypothetical protein
MRKIISKKSEAQKKKKNQIIVGIILVVIMFGSTFGIIVDSFGKNTDTKNRIIYNEIEFVKSNDYWFAKIRGIDFAFKYSPKEVIFIDGKVNDLDEYADMPVYVYSEDYTAELEIYRNFNNIAQRIQGACLEKCDKNLPIKTCEDRFIIIQESNETNIVQDKNCVYITGNKEDLIKITDEFLFKTIGIKE